MWRMSLASQDEVQLLDDDDDDAKIGLISEICEMGRIGVFLKHADENG